MIGKDSARIQVVLSKEDADKLEKKADAEGRSVSNMAAQLIKKALKAK